MAGKGGVTRALTKQPYSINMESTVWHYISSFHKLYKLGNLVSMNIYKYIYMSYKNIMHFIATNKVIQCEVLLRSDLPYAPLISHLTVTLSDTISLGLLSRTRNLGDPNINIYEHKNYVSPLVRRGNGADPDSLWSNSFSDQISILVGETRCQIYSPRRGWLNVLPLVFHWCENKSTVTE